MTSQRKTPSGQRNTTKRQFLSFIGAFVGVSAVFGVVMAGLFIPLATALGVTLKALPEIFDSIPEDIEVVTPSEESIMVDQDGNVIARFYSEQRVLVDSDEIADVMKEAMVAIEDERFYEHNGIDAEGMIRAAINNLAGGSLQGASTITQQYVRNLLIEKGIQEGDQELIDFATEESLVRKVIEARYAVALEKQMTKEEILTGYLNIVTFGTSVYGVEAAATAYFSKSASELTLSEAALLAGLVQSPSTYDPLVNPDAAQERRDVVLAVMLQQGKITQDEYDEATALSVSDMLNPQETTQGCAGAGENAYFCSYALQEFLSNSAFGDNETARLAYLRMGGLVIETTLDPEKQAAAYEAVTDLIPVGDSSGVNSALVSVEPSTGNILVMAQNTNYGTATESDPTATEVNYTAGTSRGGGSGFQAGSTFKVFTLVQWFKEGHGAYDTVGSSNRTYANGSFTCDGTAINTESWTVNDLSGKDGQMTVLRATQLSVNQAYVNMASKVDFCEIFETAADMGVTEQDGSTIDALPANIIGSAEVTPLQMASAFGTFVNDGEWCEPTSISRVTDKDGVVFYESTPSCTAVLDETVAAQVATTLRLSAQNYSISLGDYEFGAKSGTTDDNSNTWMVGFTANLATAGWAGYGSSSSTPVTNVTINGTYWSAVYGETFVGPMWEQYMLAALDGTTAEALPYANVSSGSSSSQDDDDEGSEDDESADSSDSEQDSTDTDLPTEDSDTESDATSSDSAQDAGVGYLTGEINFTDEDEATDSLAGSGFSGTEDAYDTTGANRSSDYGVYETRGVSRANSLAASYDLGRNYATAGFSGSGAITVLGSSLTVSNSLDITETYNIRDDVTKNYILDRFAGSYLDRGGGGSNGRGGGTRAA